jgi:hypothetical protein
MVTQCNLTEFTKVLHVFDACLVPRPGARQLFIGDVETGRTAFQPLYSFLAEQVWSGPGPRIHCWSAA